MYSPRRVLYCGRSLRSSREIMATSAHKAWLAFGCASQHSSVTCCYHFVWPGYNDTIHPKASLTFEDLAGCTDLWQACCLTRCTGS